MPPDAFSGLQIAAVVGVLDPLTGFKGAASRWGGKDERQNEKERKEKSGEETG